MPRSSRRVLAARSVPRPSMMRPESRLWNMRASSTGSAPGTEHTAPSRKYLQLAESEQVLHWNRSPSFLATALVNGDFVSGGRNSLVGDEWSTACELRWVRKLNRAL